MIPQLERNGNMENGTKRTTITRLSSDGTRHSITYRTFVADIASAGRIGHAVWTWNGTTRAGEPVTIAWVTGWRSGRVVSVYELPAGE